MSLRNFRRCRGANLAAKAVAASIFALPACGTHSAAIEYQRQDRANRFLDQYYSTKSYCKNQGLAIVVEQNRAEVCKLAERRFNGGYCPPRPGDRIIGCAPR